MTQDIQPAKTQAELDQLKKDLHEECASIAASLMRIPLMRKLYEADATQRAIEAQMRKLPHKYKDLTKDQ